MNSINSQHIIEVIQLTHRYGKFVAVDNINLSVHQGEIFGFLGPNGAGKTTTIRMILDFIRPSQGQVKVFGMDSRANSLEIRQRLGYLPAELKLLDNWSGLQYIKWLEGLRGGQFMAEALRLGERFDFDLKRPLKGMSTGMKRKMGLITALAHKPELLILDEPTSGLDPLMQQAFNETMREIRAEGRTVFLSSHNLPEVEQICDRVGIIRKGELQAVESLEGLAKVAFRWMSLTVNSGAELNGFSKINGVSDLSRHEQTLRMKISGAANIDEVIKQAAQYTVEDISIEHPSLEEVFMTYYGGNGYENDSSLAKATSKASKE